MQKPSVKTGADTLQNRTGPRADTAKHVNKRCGQQMWTPTPGSRLLVTECFVDKRVTPHRSAASASACQSLEGFVVRCRSTHWMRERALRQRRFPLPSSVVPPDSSVIVSRCVGSPCLTPLRNIMIIVTLSRSLAIVARSPSAAPRPKKRYLTKVRFEPDCTFVSRIVHTSTPSATRLRHTNRSPQIE